LGNRPERQRSGSGRGRQVVAVLLSLIQPGAGHYLVGSFRRGTLWVVGLTGVAVLFLLAVPIRVTTLLAALAVAFIARLACAADTIRIPIMRPRWSRVLLGWGALVAVSVLVEVAKDSYRSDYGATFTIASSAMAEALLHGDYIIVNRSAYHADAPRRGDIVVFS
jgi:hypothetical protein